MPRMLAAKEFLTSLSLFWANCRASVGMAAVAIDCASTACGMSMRAKSVNNTRDTTCGHGGCQVGVNPEVELNDGNTK